MRLYLANHDYYQLSKARAKKILLTFYYHRGVVLESLQNKFFPDGVEIFIDSGAFSANSQSDPVDIDKYCVWLEENMNFITTYANLDVIGNQVLTRRNQEYMESEGFSPIPVFHVGSGLREFKRICDLYPYIAIGGMVPYMKRFKEVIPFLDRIFEIARDNKLHGFGCTNINALFMYPWYSVDSSTWLVGAKFGEVPVFDERKENIIRISLGDWDKWRKYRRKLESIGVDWREVASNRVINKETLFVLSRKTFEEVEEFLTNKWHT